MLKAYGRIEPRDRFKVKSGHPLLDGRQKDLLFLDESGKSGKGQEPVFALGAISMTQEAHKKYKRAADALKKEFFGDDRITFHEPQMRRHETIFRFDGKEDRQREFCEAVDDLVRSSEFTVFGVAIRKTEFAEFLTEGSDPYLPWDTYGVAIHLLLERYVDYLAKTQPKRLGRATFESQGPVEDASHHLEYTSLLLSGTQWVPATNFRNWLETSARFVPKGGSHGTEIADMFSRDLYEWVRYGCGGVPRRWESFSQKIYRRGDLRMGKFGVKVFPDADLRPEVEAHREWCAGN
ncbi:MAG: DUF3800 domain-containing protein [Candidatus Hydrogenedentes bacterium]|nr:DUF3800 domain-containing protein [Candidatus Hydrogenedentota bacterium]